MENTALIISMCVGIGLSAACGFRVFLPLFVLSFADWTGYFQLSQSFDWLGTLPAMIALGVATFLEIGAYYIPWLDNLLDTLASPLAVFAGILIMASSLPDTDPFLRWSLAVIAGGGIAGIFQGLTAMIRGTSTATTGGLANPLVTTGETGGAFVLSVLSIMIPILMAVIVLFLIVILFRKLFQRRSRDV